MAENHIFLFKIFFRPWDTATWAAVPLVPPLAPMMSGSGEGTPKRVKSRTQLANSNLTDFTYYFMEEFQHTTRV